MLAGRPWGSFGEPAHRARAWHWLVIVQAIAKVEKIQELDQNSPRHPLMRNVPPARRFEAIALDGYNPSNQLLEHVAGKRGYEDARSAYMHPLWMHLIERDPRFPERDTWLARQLECHGILRVEAIDEEHGVELGLMPGEQGFPVDHIPSLNLQSQRFLSLDGLLLLLLLYREAQDVGHREQATMFQEALNKVCYDWMHHYRYAGEVLETWQFLTETRMVRWIPRFRASLEELQYAEKELTEELQYQRAKPKPKASPEHLRNGRAERRWRRRVMMRAYCLRYDHVLDDPNFSYRDVATPYDWLVANRQCISQHRDSAIDILMNSVNQITTGLPPLLMPKSLRVTRRRPAVRNPGEMLYEDASIFDLMPVESESTSNTEAS